MQQSGDTNASIMNQPAQEIRPITRDHRLTVRERIERDPAFAEALREEAARLIANGEPETAQLLLRA